MKTIILGMLVFLLSLNSQAQNQDKKTETKTTITTVKDNKGEHKIVKKEETNEIQNIELNEVPAGTLNTDTKPSPVHVTKTTKVSVDGEERTIDVDHSAYYVYNNEKYQVALDKSGYTMTNPNITKPMFLRRTSNNNYIYKNKDKFSVGYFNADGNLVLETYDEKTDKITIETYNLQK